MVHNKKRNLAKAHRLTTRVRNVYAPSVSHNTTTHVDELLPVEGQYSNRYEYQVKPYPFLDGNNRPTIITVSGHTNEWLNDSATDISYLSANLLPSKTTKYDTQNLVVYSGNTTGVESFIARTEYQVIEEWIIRIDGGTSSQVSLDGDLSISMRHGVVDSSFLSLQDSDYINDLTLDSNLGVISLRYNKNIQSLLSPSANNLRIEGNNILLIGDGRTAKENQDLPFNVFDSNFDIASYADNEYVVPREWYDSAVANGGGGGGAVIAADPEAWS